MLQDGSGFIEMRDASGNSIKLEAGGITITAATKLTISAPTLEISTPMLKADAAMSKFSGVAQANTIIANAVVGSSYTPGAGNTI